MADMVYPTSLSPSPASSSGGTAGGKPGCAAQVCELGRCPRNKAPQTGGPYTTGILPVTVQSTGVRDESISRLIDQLNSCLNYIRDLGAFLLACCLCSHAS